MIIGSVVGGVLVLFLVVALVVALVVFCRVKRRSSGPRSAPTSKDVERTPPGNVLNAAYDPGSSEQASVSTSFQDEYETVHDYASLKPDTRDQVSADSNYQSLITPEGQRLKVDLDSENYAQLDSNRREYDDDENYTKLNKDLKPSAASKDKGQGLENHVADDAIHEEVQRDILL